MDRLVSLSVGVEGDEDYANTFQKIAEVAKNLGDSHPYVSVSVSLFDELDSASEPVREVEYHDDFTLVKVHQALMAAGAPYGLGEQQISDMIASMQNAGILFRERAK